MTTVATPPSTDGRKAVERDLPSARRQAVGRNRGRIAAGALLLAASALLAVAIYSSVGDRKPVLALSQVVDPGAVIEADDLTVVRVAVDANVATVPASQRSAVVGQRAAVRLFPGMLLSQAAIARGPVLPPGSSVIGAIVRSGQYPMGLRPGDEVLVVVTGGTSGGAPSDPVPATIVSVSSSSGADGTAISLAVPSREAPRLAVAGAEARLVLVVPAA